MELRPVVSSNIEAEGYDPAAKILRIKFKAGKAYDYAGVDVEQYAAFLASQSKGRFVHAILRPKLIAEAQVDRPQAFIQPDECCAEALSKALASGKIDGSVWVHNKCGVEWRLDVREGASMVWKPSPDVSVF